MKFHSGASDIKYAMKNMKNKEALGKDKSTIENLKALNENGLKILTDLSIEVYTGWERTLAPPPPPPPPPRLAGTRNDCSESYARHPNTSIEPKLCQK